MICERCAVSIRDAFLHFFGENSDADQLSSEQSKSEPYRGWSYGWQFAKWRNAVSAGCSICVILWARFVENCSFSNMEDGDSVLTNFAVPVSGIVHNLSHLNSFSYFDSVTICMTVWLEDDSENKLIRGLDCQHKFYIEPITGDAYKTELKHQSRQPTLSQIMLDEGVPKSLMSSTGDMTAWKTVMKWVDDCQKFHEHCHSLRGTTKTWPSRLIDLGRGDVSMATVVSTKQNLIRGPYVTLSHCWGGQLRQKLVRTNLQKYSQSLPLEAMPSTFREAAIVTRRLGIRYLWIDALCILQDDKEDWREQSAAMADIYANSFLTIAAHAAIDSSGGLFQKRPNSFARTTIIAICEPSAHSGKHIVYPQCLLNDFRRGQLFTRGWTFQERIFSQRCLFFGKNTVFWECRSTGNRLYAEAFLGGICQPFDYDVGQISAIEILQGSAPKIGASQDFERMARSWWYQAVKTYTSRKLTRRSDRLVALSAVAKKCRQYLQTEYVAGLWDKWLLDELCWAIEQPVDRSGKYVAPSWSWAAVDGRVSANSWTEVQRSQMPLANDGDARPDIEVNRGTLDDSIDSSNQPSAHSSGGGHQHHLAHVKTYEIVPAGSDQTGELVAGWLCLSGMLLRTSRGRIEQMRPPFHTWAEGSGTFSPGLCQVLEASWDYSYVHKAVHDTLLFMLPLIKCKQHAVGVLRSRYLIKGIILEPLDDDDTQSKDFYRRVGMFVVDADAPCPWREHLLQDFLLMHHSQEGGIGASVPISRGEGREMPSAEAETWLNRIQREKHEIVTLI